MTSCLPVSVSETSVQRLPDSSTPGSHGAERQVCGGGGRPCLLPHCDERLPRCLFGSWGFVFILQGGGLTATVSVVHVSVETRGNISVFTFRLIF